METVPAARTGGKYITFRVARLDFAMDASRVRGIVPVNQIVSQLTPHEWIAGFAVLGSRDFPVIDLRRKLGLAEGSPGRQPSIITVEAASSTGPHLIGFIADRISEVIDVRSRDLHKGKIRNHGRARRVLDPNTIMSDQDLAALMPTLVSP